MISIITYKQIFIKYDFYKKKNMLILILLLFIAMLVLFFWGEHRRARDRLISNEVSKNR